MPASLLEQAYVRAARPVVRWAMRSVPLRRHLLARRAADLAAGLDPDTAIVLELARLVGADSLVGGSPAVERGRMRANVAVVEDMPAGGLDVTAETAEGASGSIPARLYAPRDLPRPSPALVFVHGGGWVTGDLETHDTLCRRIALIANIRVIAIAPRLAPEHRFPAPLDDTVAAFRSIARRAAELGFDPERIGIGGDSAGGNLSAIVGLETRADAMRPALTALLYPATDATWSRPSIRTRGQGFLLTKQSLDWYREHYIGADESLRRHPRVSPFFAPDLKGAPRALVAVAGFDPLCDEGVAYAKRLADAGTVVDLLRYEGLIHGFLLMTSVSQAAMAATEEIAERIGAILRERKEWGVDK